MDHYTILEVDRSATPDDIKKAYRKQAMKYHPDRNPGDPDADTKFKQVQSAYDTLHDEDKKRVYDHSNIHTPVHSPKKEENFNWFSERQVPIDDLNKIQCSFFGGESTGRNIQTHLYLDKEQMRTGGTATVTIKKRKLCSKCVGDGSENKICTQCHGSGRLTKMSQYGYASPPCHKCKAVGHIPYPCKDCSGAGVKNWLVKDVRVAFPKDSKSGQQITILGEGEHKPLKMPGYLRIVLLEKVD